MHRDLKPENLLYESDKEGSMLKVIDFGTSREFDPSVKLNQKLGTVRFNLQALLHCTRSFKEEIRRKMRHLVLRGNFVHFTLWLPSF